MLRPLRAEANALLQAVATRRKPALRRSDAPDAILATDLPFAADAEAVAGFNQAAKAAGWDVRPADNGWLLLDREIPAPQVAIPPCPAGACGRCISILQRHPDGADARAWIRRIVTAQEAGGQAFERACGLLHAELAARLRLHQPLPGALLPYLAQAYNASEMRREAP